VDYLPNKEEGTLVTQTGKSGNISEEGWEEEELRLSAQANRSTSGKERKMRARTYPNPTKPGERWKASSPEITGRGSVLPTAGIFREEKTTVRRLWT